MRLVLDGYGWYVGKKRNRITVKKMGENVGQYNVKRLDQVVVKGKGSFSFDALWLLAEFGVSVLFLGWQGDLVGRLVGKEVGTVSTRREQYLAYFDERGGVLARGFVSAKIKNMSATLGTLGKSRRRSGMDVGFVRGCREEMRVYLDSLTGLGGCLDEVRGALFGAEGGASSVYWNCVSRLLGGLHGFTYRSGRGAVDPVNALLNYGYSLLMGEMSRAVHMVGLDPFGGFLHTDRSGRVSLVFDLMDEFRQQTVDKVVFGLACMRLEEDDFTVSSGLCLIREAARKLLVKSVLKKFQSEVVYEGVRRSYSDLMYHQARKVVRFLRGESDTYSGFSLRW